MVTKPIGINNFIRVNEIVLAISSSCYGDLCRMWQRISDHNHIIAGWNQRRAAGDWWWYSLRVEVQDDLPK